MTSPKPTRQEALATGLNRYFGKVCAKHPSGEGERYTTTGNCRFCLYAGNIRRANVRYRTDPEYRAKKIAMSTAYNADHRETCRVNVTKSTAKNKHKYVARLKKEAIKRRQGVKVSTPAWADKKEIAAVYAKAKSQSMCVDHVIPLRHPLVCGLHVHNNLQILTLFENATKGNRFDVA